MDGKDKKKDIQVRLRRIEGQIKGIEKMVENECCCKDVLVQISAVRAAINKVGGILLENYAKTCLLNKEEENSEENMEQLVSTLLTFMK